MIKEDKIINEWSIYSFREFVEVFKPSREELLKDFPDLNDIEDYCESSFYDCDEVHIMDYLNRDKRLFRVNFMDSSRNNAYEEYWRIREVEE